ncbi:cytochrome P450 [Aureobasidium subglaciale]|nr:cytochrome P450 [Aureobasidium subglaciale]
MLIESILSPNGSYGSAILGLISGAGLLLVGYRALFHPLAQFPGPRLAAISGLWQIWHYAIGDWTEVILELHQKHGKIVRLAPNELSVVDEEAMRALYGHGTTAIKGSWYSGFQPPQAAPNILATQDPKVHASVRRRIAPAFKMTAVLRLESSMQDCLDVLWQRLGDSASEGVAVDMCHAIDTLTWDIMGQLCYGEPLGSIVGAEKMNLQGILNSLMMVSTILGLIWGQLFWVDNAVTRILGIKNPIEDFFNWSSAKVQEHEDADRSNAQPDMVDHFLAYRDSEGNPPSHLQVVDGAFAVTYAIILGDTLTARHSGAGADTVAIAMRSTLYHLSFNPAVLRKLQTEIDQADTGESTSYKQTQQLPYLKAVVRESLRMYPSIPAQLPRVVPAGGLSVNGHSISSGTVIGISSLAQNRDTTIFGQDANVFNPERWLGEESEARSLEAALFNFGGIGPRSCPGRDLAMIELYKFVAQMVQKFEFELDDKERPISAKTYFFVLQSEMRMKLARRERRVKAQAD